MTHTDDDVSWGWAFAFQKVGDPPRYILSQLNSQKKLTRECELTAEQAQFLFIWLDAIVKAFAS